MRVKCLMNNIKILNYQGNKTSLLNFISESIEKYIENGDAICDIFSGSGSVGCYFSDSHPIIANDIELYSSIISSALLNPPSKYILIKEKNAFKERLEYNYFALKKDFLGVIDKEQQMIEDKDNDGLISLYNSFPTVFNKIDPIIRPENLKQKGEYNLFVSYYSGTYFGIAQSIYIDAAIKTIHQIKDKSVKCVAYSCLYYAMSEIVFAKDGHMAQPLDISKNKKRHIKQRSKNLKHYIMLKYDEFIEAASEYKEFSNKIYNKDVVELLKDPFFSNEKIKLIYADPPYTDMQYSRYYHLLNVATKYDFPEPTVSKGKYTKGLYTEGRNQSLLSQKNGAKKVLYELFEYCKAKNIILALSFGYPQDTESQKTDRYTISVEQLIEMAENVFGFDKVHIEQMNYKHSNHRNSHSKEVYEYLIICGEIIRTNFDLMNTKKELRSLIPNSKNPVYNSYLYWSQKSYNVIDCLISNLSREGEVVFDPFMGSGVTVLESVKDSQNRIAVGCDLNEMPKFIINNILCNIPKTDLVSLFGEFEKKIDLLNKYYETSCKNCGEKSVITKVIFDKPERTKNKFKIKAITYRCPKCGKMIKQADDYDYCKLSIDYSLKSLKDERLIPNSKIAVGKNDTISMLFTPRNFAVLDEMMYIISQCENKDVLNFLLMSVLHLAKITDTHSNSQWPLWIPKVNCVEKNIVEIVKKRIKALIECKNYISSNYSKGDIKPSFEMLKKNEALILTKGSQYISNEDIPDNSVSLIITDPPYLDQVMYSEYMQLYKPFVNLGFNLEDEIIVSNAENRKRNKEEYFDLLDKVFRICSKKLKENHYMCLFFHDSNLTVWAELIEMLEKNGFQFISQEHIKKGKTVKNILSPKKSLSGDAILFFENKKNKVQSLVPSLSIDEIEYSVYLEAKKLLELNGDLSTPELYDMGVIEMLIQNGWLKKLSKKYKTLVDIFENHFIWKREIGKWHLQ